MPHRVHVGLGSNLGDPRTNVRNAIARIAALDGITLRATSSLWETEPLGDLPEWFVNAAVAIDTTLDPGTLLERLQTIEAEMGRRRVAGERWASRTIDLDVLLVDDLVLRTPTLTVPHPEMHRRRFVLAPLAEIAPDAIHPVLGQPIGTLLRTVADAKRVARIEDA